MERIKRGEHSCGRLAVPLLLLVSVALGGCVTSSPETELSWPVGVTYTVQPGDTLSEIAENYRTSEGALAGYNEIGDRDRIYTGQVLRIPRDSYAVVPHDPPRPKARPYSEPRRYAAVAREMPRRSKTYVRSAPHDPVEAEGDYAHPVSFVWPVDGPIISPFGVSINGQRNDGINIAANFGEPIHAAAAGTVTYAGNELKGYGNLILIRHDDGYVTAYAHAERIAVERGERVAKGEVIGYAGATGDVTRPQLHFEIRHGVRPVDPKLLLVASNA